MTNGGIIEGNPRDILAFSDLSLVIGYAGRWTNISSLAFLRTSRRLDGSGATLRAVSLRKPAIEKEARLRPQHITLLGCCLGNTKGNAAACVLAGYHHSPSRNRIKTGQSFFSRSRMGNAVTDAHARSIAVAQRLYSATLGAGRPACKCEASNGSGGLLLVRHPAPDTL